MVRQVGRIKPSFDMKESKRASFFNQTDSCTNNTITRMQQGGLLAGDNRTSFLLDWIKLDWGFDLLADNNQNIIFLIREPVGGAALDEIGELSNHVVWWDAKYTLVGTDSSGFQILSDTETFVNFLPDEEMEIGDGEQLSIYFYPAGSAGTTVVDWNMMAKFHIIRRQVNHPNDNAYFDLTAEESIQWFLDS